ncbi:MAG TPA: cation:proton antiporter, partial [Gemmatimonadaceae bacterium]|nr:cation:proton antiporter [Gemmatimonadaceae bacterium]
MREFEIILGLVFVASLLQPVARRFDVPLAIAQVFGGILLSTLPLFPTVPFDPELTFVLFVPPLLYRAASTSSLRDTRKNARPIFLLAEQFGASGVLAVVAAGAVSSRSPLRTTSARTRVRTNVVWDTATFAIGALVF